jgi:hypothetical protein
MNSMFKTLHALLKGFGFLYFVFATCIGFLLGLIWSFVRPIHKRRAAAALFIALAVAPSLFGFDMGAITLPALVVIIVGLRSLRTVALVWSIISILVTWSLVLLIWTSASKFSKGRR